MKLIFILFACVLNSHSLFALSTNYQSLTAQQKKVELWNEIKANPYSELPQLNSGIGIGFILSSLNTFSSLAVSFDHTDDIMPIGRRKIIHPFGSVAPIRWESEKNNPYTGIFQSGGVGLARLSIAGDPDLLGMTTGMAIKIFINKQPSVNLQVMYSLDGQGNDNNFFAHNFTNNIPEPKSLILKPLAALFALVQNPPTYLPVDHFAAVNRKGVNIDNPVAPYALVFKPSAEVENLFPSDSTNDFRNDLASLNIGTTIYDIYALKNKSDRSPILIGHLVIEDHFVASEFEDQKLFFQHHH